MIQKPNFTSSVIYPLAEAWKYGERAFRYCQHDIGHALAALSYAAACLGWSIELCSEAGDSNVAHWLGLDRSDDFVEHERETADLFCRLRTDRQIQVNSMATVYHKSYIRGMVWNRRTIKWTAFLPLADHRRSVGTSAKTRYHRRTLASPSLATAIPSHNLTASRLIRQRRSAQQFNGKAESLPLADFQRMLLALLANAKPPYTAWNCRPSASIYICA